MHLLHYKHQAVDKLIKKVFSSFFHLFTTMNSWIKLKPEERKCLFRFLKEENIFNCFFKEVVKQHRKIIFDGNSEIVELINFSLTWDNTEQGYDFWNKKDSKWRRHVLNLKNSSVF